MKYLFLLIIACCVFLVSCAEVEPQHNVSSVWKIDSLEKIAGTNVLVSGTPEVIESEQGTAVRFDGDGDRLLVSANPLGDTQKFTVEIVFNPADAYPNNIEPRFFHIEAEDNPNRRLTIELRLNDKNQWYLDAYIKSEVSQLTLIDSTKVHPIGQWAHAAVTYKDREFVSYVNGVRELRGEVDYLPIAAHAKTSIGARMNQVHWFKGDIAQVRISHRVLEPAEFIALPTTNQ